MSNFDKNVRLLRIKKGLTQAELGERIDVSQPVINDYESGKITPKPQTLVRLARALGTTVEQLVESEIGS